MLTVRPCPRLAVNMHVLQCHCSSRSICTKHTPSQILSAIDLHKAGGSVCKCSVACRCQRLATASRCCCCCCWLTRTGCQNCQVKKSQPGNFRCRWLYRWESLRLAQAAPNARCEGVTVYSLSACIAWIPSIPIRTINPWLISHADSFQAVFCEVV